MLGVIIGLAIGGLVLGWLLDLHQPEEIMRRGAEGEPPVTKWKGCLFWVLMLLAALMLLAIEILPPFTIGGIPSK